MIGIENCLHQSLSILSKKYLGRFHLSQLVLFYFLQLRRNHVSPPDPPRSGQLENQLDEITRKFLVRSFTIKPRRLLINPSVILVFYGQSLRPYSVYLRPKYNIIIYEFFHTLLQTKMVKIYPLFYPWCLHIPCFEITYNCRIVQQKKV